MSYSDTNQNVNSNVFPSDLLGLSKPTSGQNVSSFRYIICPLEGGTNYNTSQPANIQLNCGSATIWQSGLTVLEATINPTGTLIAGGADVLLFDGPASIIDSIQTLHNGTQIDELLNYSDIYNNYLQWSQSFQQYASKWSCLMDVIPPENYGNGTNGVNTPQNLISVAGAGGTFKSVKIFIPLIGGIFSLPYLDTRAMNGQFQISIRWRNPQLAFWANGAINNFNYTISSLRLHTQQLDMDNTQYSLIARLRGETPKFYGFSWTRNLLSLSANQTSLSANIAFNKASGKTLMFLQRLTANDVLTQMTASRQRNNLSTLQYTINSVKVPQTALTCDSVGEITTENIKALHSLDNLFHNFLPDRTTFDNTYWSSFIDLEAYTGYGIMLSGANVKSSNIQMECKFNQAENGVNVGQSNILLVLVYDICYWIDKMTRQLNYVD